MSARGRPIRVLTLICDLGPGFGGAELVAHELVRRLDDRRFRRYACITRAPPPEKEAIVAETVSELRADGVGVLRLDRRSTADVLPWRALGRLLRSESIDVVHGHMFKSNLAAAVLGRLTGVPLVVAHEHTWSFDGRPVRRVLDREVIARTAGLFLAVSDADARRMVEVEGIPAERVRHLPNGAPELPPPTGHDVRAELGIPPGAHVVGTACVLRPQKALHHLVDATARLRGEGLDLHLVIAGQGPLRDDLRAQADGLGLGDRVHLMGLRRDIPDVLAALDVAAISSDYEGTPLALMEYMAAGRPIVSTAVGGVPELVEHERHALLVEPGDPAALAAAIGRLLRSPELASRLGSAARSRQRERLSLDAMVRELESLYVERLAAARR